MPAKMFSIAPLGALPEQAKGLPVVPIELAQILSEQFKSKASPSDAKFEFDLQYFKDPNPEPFEEPSEPKKAKPANNKNLVGLKYDFKVKKIIASVPEETRELACKEIDAALETIARKYRPNSA